MLDTRAYLTGFKRLWGVKNVVLISAKQSKVKIFSPLHTHHSAVTALNKSSFQMADQSIDLVV